MGPLTNHIRHFQDLSLIGHSLAPLAAAFVCDWPYRPCFILRGAMVAASGRPVRCPPAADSRAHPILPVPVQSLSEAVLGHFLCDALPSRRFYQEATEQKFVASTHLFLSSSVQLDMTRDLGQLMKLTLSPP